MANAYEIGGMEAVEPMLVGLSKHEQDVIKSILTMSRQPEALRRRLHELGVKPEHNDPLPILP